MGQNIENGINGINQGMEYTKGIRTDNRRVVSGENAFLENTDACRYDKQAERGQPITDGYEEYIRNKNEQAHDDGTDEAAREREERKAARELARSLTDEEIKQLTMMGIDLTGARLSDVSGIVNTMRGNAHREEMSELLASVSIDEGDMDGVSVVGGRVMSADIELDVSVSDVLADELSDGQTELKRSDNAFIYMVRNGLSMTSENIYKAYYSANTGSITGDSAISGDVFNDMLPQLEKLISQAGYEGDERALAGVSLLLDSMLPVTAGTIKAYMEYYGFDVSENTKQNIFIAGDDADLLSYKAGMLYDRVKDISPDIVYNMALEGREITLASAYRYSMSYYGTYGKTASSAYDFTDDEDRLRAVTQMRQMEEIRLSMTLDAATRLLGRDMDIDTRELSQVVQELKNTEDELIGLSLRGRGVEATDENISIYRELSEKAGAIASEPASVIALPLKQKPFTIRALYDEGEAVLAGMTDGLRSAAEFEKAGRQYEAAKTIPRSDMGDSIHKAFENVDNILESMGIQVSDETRRAVRILGYNQIEITQSNISDVADYDRQVNELIDNFYPEAVISVIRDGINPLDIPIGELNRMVREANYNNGVTEASDFAAYLRDIESKGDITPEERESYIGIYRVMSRLEKSGDREAGSLFASGRQLTVRNLISAMRSRRAVGMDVGVGADFGLLEERNLGQGRMDEQIEAAFKKNDIADMADKLTPEVEEFMAENNIEYTLVNAAAVSELISDRGLYGLVSEVLAKLKLKDDSDEDMIDDETDNMTRSMLGDGIPVEFTPDSILETLNRGTDMSFAYNDLRNKVTELMYEAGASGIISSMDISAVKTLQAGFNILSNMARSDHYQVPVETEDGVTVVNLTINRDSDNAGTIALSTVGGKTGKITAKLRLAADKTLTGWLSAETMEGNTQLMALEKDFNGRLSRMGYITEGVTVGTGVGEAEYGAADNYVPPKADELYSASVELVRALAEITK